MSHIAPRKALSSKENNRPIPFPFPQLSIRGGAGDENTGSHFAGHGEEDHVVVGGGEFRHLRPADAALAPMTRLAALR
jgi:hypothetical protein